MTAKDQNGNVIHTERRKYENWNLWFDGAKEVELRLWDITATTNMNLGIEPGEPSEETHIVLLGSDAESVTIEAKFLFEHTPDNWEVIKTVTRTLKVESSDKYYTKKK